jgi:hypothetical protein
VVLVALQWLLRYVVPAFAPETLYFGVMGALAIGLLVVLWWLFLSRAPWVERLGAVGLLVVGAVAVRPLLHDSVRTGMMGLLFLVYAIPVLSLALVAWAAATRGLAAGPRRATMAATLLLASGAFALLRTGGISGADSDFHWRWSPTPEERLLAQGGGEPPPPVPPAATAETPAEPVPAAAGEPAAVAPAAEGAAAPAGTEPAPPPVAMAAEPAGEKLAAAAGAEPDQAPATPAATVAPGEGAAAAAEAAVWPAFRGPRRDGVARGARISTDWAASPPVELWRRPVGPGWSSFAVRGDLAYTQEQRGEHEVVSCYRAATGEPVWWHRDPVRFWESNAGAGPRATPTLADGRLYTLGATGIVNALDAGDGAVVWSRDAAADTETKVPGWGFAGSPLVVGDLLVVATGGRLVAYDLATGAPRWLGPAGGGYSSPHLATIAGVPQVLQLSGAGLKSFAPADGTLLWEHPWPGVPIVQPALTEDGDLLLSVSESEGLRRLAVAQGPGGWTVTERWTSRGLKPYFNDFVVHEGHAYGFDGSILSCIDVASGERRWKGGRYGQGQLVLLPEQDLLLVLSEQGELALVSATPDGYTEHGRMPAIAGKTWNHPVVAGDLLLVRNAEEMVGYRLTPAGG